MQQNVAWLLCNGNAPAVVFRIGVACFAVKQGDFLFAVILVRFNAKAFHKFFGEELFIGFFSGHLPVKRVCGKGFQAGRNFAGS